MPQLHVGLWTVIVGGAIGIAAFLYLALHEDSNLYAAFMKSVAADILTMALLGIAERFVRNRKVSGGRAHAGPEGVDVEMTFENQIANVVATVNERMNDHVATINQRLYDLEKHVFERGEAASEESE